MNGIGWSFAIMAVLAGCDAQATLQAPAAGVIAAFPGHDPACSRSQEHAQKHALELERTADAHWERVPFSRGEAPTAVIEMAEAESCFSLAGERAGRLRAQGKRRLFVQEVERRLARARLNLDVAMRLGQPHRAVQEANEIVALLKHSEETGYRQTMQRLANQFAAAEADSQQKGRP